MDANELWGVLQGLSQELGTTIERSITDGLAPLGKIAERMANPATRAGKLFDGSPGEEVGDTPYPRIGGVSISGPFTVSVAAPCGCSMPMQFKIHADYGKQPPLADDVQGVLLGSHQRAGLALEFTEVGSPIPCASHKQKEGWPVRECPECEGYGTLGDDPRSGKAIACETCGGNEDRLGDGWLQIVVEPRTDPSVARISRLLTGIPALLDRLGEDGAGNKVSDAIAELVPGRALINVTALDAARDIARVADHYAGEAHVGDSTVSVNLADLRTLRAALPKEEV